MRLSQLFGVKKGAYTGADSDRIGLIEKAILIQNEASGNGTDVTLLMVHAQEHLMNAITIKDMAIEFVDLYEKIGIISDVKQKL